MKSLYLVGLLILTPGLIAATRTAATASRADVVTAYNSCADGDTLSVPAGSSTWSSPVVIQKRVTVKGAGVDQTVLISSGGLPLFRIYTNNVRVTGFSFNGNHQDTSNQGLVQIGTTSGTTACDNVYIIKD